MAVTPVSSKLAISEIGKVMVNVWLSPGSNRPVLSNAARTLPGLPKTASPCPSGRAVIDLQDLLAGVEVAHVGDRGGYLDVGAHLLGGYIRNFKTV